MGDPDNHDLTSLCYLELPGWEEMPSTIDLLGDVNQLPSSCLGSLSSVKVQAQLQMRPSGQAVTTESSRKRAHLGAL